MLRISLLALLLLLNIKGTCQEALSKQDLYRFEGTYDFNQQRQVTLGIFDELNHSLAYLDLQSLKIGILIPLAKNSFRDRNDSTTTFSFMETNGVVTGLSITNKQQVSSGKKVSPHEMTTVSFNSAKNILKGHLYLPATNGPHPAVIFAHGSGPSTRGVGFFTTFFLQLGIGVLTFDKQGAGESTGDWETASFDDLSNDVLAGLSFLKTHPKIDKSKIGLMGNSQGGWIGSIVASKSPDLAFMLIRVGAGESVFQTVSHEYRGSLKADGLSSTEIDEIMPMYHEHWQAALAGKTWEEGNQLLSKYKSKPWFKKLYPTERIKTLSAEKWWLWLQKNMNFDPYPYLKQVKTPTLWLMGEKDWNVNSQRSYPRIIEALKRAGNKDYHVAIIPGMSHNGMAAKTGYYNEAPSFIYAHGFWSEVRQWLKNRRLSIEKR